MNQLRSNYSSPKESYTNQKLPSFNYNFEKKLADTNNLRAENLRNFQEASKSPESLKKYIDQQEGRSPSTSNQVQGSFDRMMNIGQVGGLGGRMGSLEQASMRLAEAASQRRVGEMEREYGLKGGLLEKEISAKTAGIGAEAKASERASLESQMRALQSKGRLTPEEQDRLSQISRQLASIR
jgi:hypothetical protein